MLTATNNKMVINKNVSKNIEMLCFTGSFTHLKFIGIVFVSTSIISSRVIPESTIILAQYFPFSQLHVAGFQI